MVPSKNKVDSSFVYSTTTALSPNPSPAINYLDRLPVEIIQEIFSFFLCSSRDIKTALTATVIKFEDLCPIKKVRKFGERRKRKVESYCSRHLTLQAQQKYNLLIRILHVLRSRQIFMLQVVYPYLMKAAPFSCFRGYFNCATLFENRRDQMIRLLKKGIEKLDDSYLQKRKERLEGIQDINVLCLEKMEECVAVLSQMQLQIHLTIDFRKRETSLYPKDANLLKKIVNASKEIQVAVPFNWAKCHWRPVVHTVIPIKVEKLCLSQFRLNPELLKRLASCSAIQMLSLTQVDYTAKATRSMKYLIPVIAKMAHLEKFSFLTTTIDQGILPEELFQFAQNKQLREVAVSLKLSEMDLQLLKGLDFSHIQELSLYTSVQSNEDMDLLAEIVGCFTHLNSLQLAIDMSLEGSYHLALSSPSIRQLALKSYTSLSLESLKLSLPALQDLALEFQVKKLTLAEGKQIDTIYFAGDFNQHSLKAHLPARHKEMSWNWKELLNFAYHCWNWKVLRGISLDQKKDIAPPECQHLQTLHLNSKDFLPDHANQRRLAKFQSIFVQGKSQEQEWSNFLQQVGFTKYTRSKYSLYFKEKDAALQSYPMTEDEKNKFSQYIQSWHLPKQTFAPSSA
jgi:hypothetical protein